MKNVCVRVLVYVHVPHVYRTTFGTTVLDEQFKHNIISTTTV